jgi:hypothetical protein
MRFQASHVTLVNQQLRVTHDIDEQDVSDLEFHIRGMLDGHLGFVVSRGHSGGE